MDNAKLLISNFFDEVTKGKKELEQRAIEEYKAALLMPRKKKKKAKKSAMLLYTLACWEPNF